MITSDGLDEREHEHDHDQARLSYFSSELKPEQSNHPYKQPGLVWTSLATRG